MMGASKGLTLLRYAGSGALHFAHGMCRQCFEDFMEATGGMSEGADPPAYNADAKPKVIKFLHPAYILYSILFGRTLALRTSGTILQTLRMKLPFYKDTCPADCKIWFPLVFWYPD